MVCRPEAPEAGGIERAANATLILPTAGVFRLHLGREDTFVVDPTQAVFLPAGRPHRYSHPVAGGDDCLAIELPADALEALLDELDPAAADRGGGSYVAHRLALPPWALMARRLLRHRLETGTASALEADETVAELFRAWTLARREAEGRGAETGRVLARHRERIEAVQLLLAADPGRDWRLDDLAREVASSPCHLTTLFRRATGAPIHRHLIRLRLARALDEVIGTRRDLTGLGADLGFSTPSHFAASFRRVYGVSPSELRKNSTAPATGSP